MTALSFAALIGQGWFEGVLRWFEQHNTHRPGVIQQVPGKPRPRNADWAPTVMSTEQVKLGDILRIDWDERVGHLVFWKEAEGPPVPMAARLSQVAMQMGGAAAGCTVDGAVAGVGI